MKPFTDSTGLMADPAALWNRLCEDGYLFIRQLVGAEDIDSLRVRLLPILGRAGWISKDHPLENLEADQSNFCVEPEPRYRKVYLELYKLREFHALKHHPRIIEFFEGMFGEAVFPHPTAIQRTIFPQRGVFTTPAHQDFIPIQGTPETFTVWMPLTDCPTELGSLTVAAGCHRAGVYAFKPSLGAGGLEITDPLTGHWREGGFALGDALIFHSMTPHKALPNTTNRLRLSVDYRYQRASDELAPGALTPHDGQFITWEEVYRDWPEGDALKYYWKSFPMAVRPYDSSYNDDRDRMAMEMARSGNIAALATLDRIIARNPDVEKQSAARDLRSALLQSAVMPEGVNRRDFEL